MHERGNGRGDGAPASGDLILTGGRVIDPRSGLDSVANVVVQGGAIRYIGPLDVPCREHLDASGFVVSPGFIDIHSHAQTRLGLGLQALDGVTTALDLESGALAIELQYATVEAEGRPINYGFSVSWALARMHVLAGLPMTRALDRSEAVPSALEVFQRNQRNPAWLRPADAKEIAQITSIVSDGLAAGGIGIGVMLGYAPDSGRDEYYRLAQLAERAGTAVFTHARHMSNLDPQSSLDGALELIGAAAGTGARIHICHINSTSLRRIDDVASAVSTARSLGNAVTTEAYPYTTSSTGIGAVFLSPKALPRLGIEPSAIIYLPHGRRVENAEELDHLRRDDPGGLCLIDYLDASPPGVAELLKSFDIPGTVVASDAMPIVDSSGSYLVGDEPLPVDARVHPRSTGTFARTFGWLVRELGHLSIADAIERCSTLPAELLAPFVPAMRKKGRIAVGFDADITVFDPETISDRSTALSIQPSAGVQYVIVNGTPVVRHNKLLEKVNPGTAITSQRYA